MLNLFNCLNERGESEISRKKFLHSPLRRLCAHTLIQVTLEQGGVGMAVIDDWHGMIITRDGQIRPYDAAMLPQDTTVVETYQPDDEITEGVKHVHADPPPYQALWKKTGISAYLPKIPARIT